MFLSDLRRNNHSCKDIFRNGNTFKGQCLEIFDHFVGLKDSTYAPYEQTKRFRDLFRFREDIRSQRSKIWCPGSQRLRRHPNFSLDTAVFKFLNYCYWMCKHTQIPFFA